MKRKYIKKKSYRKGAQEVRSKCTRGRPCQSVLPLKDPSLESFLWSTCGI